MRLTLIIVLIGFIGLSLGSFPETGEEKTHLEAQDGKFRDVRAAEAARVHGRKKKEKKYHKRRNSNGKKRKEKAKKKNIRNKSKRRNKSTRKRNQNNVRKGRKSSGRQKSGRREKNRERKQMRLNKSKGPVSRMEQRQETFCPVEIATALKLKYNQVRNFKKQMKRAGKHSDIVKKKKGKKDDFATDAGIVTSAVGGNLSAPACQSDSASNASSAGITLNNCSTSIEASCGDITLDPKLTGDCMDKMTAFEVKVTECEGSGSCTCWTAAVAMKSDINSCNAKNEADRVKEAKATCLKAFQACKKAQDSAVQFTASCPKPAQTSMTTTAKAGRRQQFLADVMAKNLLVRSRSVLS